MELRTQFALRSVFDKGTSFLDLCREYGIAAKTGYKWRKRFLARGPEGLANQSRRPKASPDALGEQVACEIVRLRGLHPSWGARKLLKLYRRIHSAAPWPSESSIKRILERSGLLQRRRIRPAGSAGRLRTQLDPQAPNDLWTADFKGWWYTPTGERCEPLTVRDAFSRFVLCVAIPADSRIETIRREFEQVFERYGLPLAIRSDNGQPFASARAPLGLSGLSAWWLALGIHLDRIAPGHPEQNGAHERMHRDIACELERKIDGDLEEHAAAAELWRQSYNQERPHEALQMRTPAEVYCKSPRAYRGTPDRLEYPPEYLDRKVDARGVILIAGRQIHITRALAGWNVGLKGTGNDTFALYFAGFCLGSVDVAGESFNPATAEQLREQ